MSDTVCTIGVDFGTESGRVLVLDLQTGDELAVHVVPYAHGVIDRRLVGTDEPLPDDWALQHPSDWTAVIEQGVPAALADAGVGVGQVAGLGVDFTSCTVLPADADGVPMCLAPRWQGHRHAWPKLWKHHAAQPVADRLNEVAAERGEPFLERYGGRISSEWYFPKLIELWLEDRELYEACDVFLEATDWIVWWLTGRLVRQSTTAGYKAMWSPTEGLPPAAYFEAAYPGFEHPAEKLGTQFVALGTRAGDLRPELAAALGLRDPVAVAVGNVDSFVSVPGAGVDRPRTFVMVIGTSICDMVVDPTEVRLPGITGVVRDGILPGLYGYEAGQAAVGDMLAWFVRVLGAGGDAFTQLEAEAGGVAPGASGLVALDWFNGNRTILADADLTGSILGLTLQTTAAEIYRALLESIAFGNRRIIDNFSEHGVELDRIVACGGIAERSPLTMQLIADVSGRMVDVPTCREVPARGAALFGAVAAGAFADIGAAVQATRPAVARTFVPDPQASAVYERVYRIFLALHDLLGRAQPALLHELKRIRAERRPT
jgi:L-ribulokinase